MPDVIENPVWYGPLARPAWLLPALRDGATRLSFHAPPWDPALPLDEQERGLRLGLPMFLAEAIRFTTDAATGAALEPCEAAALPLAPDEGPMRRALSVAVSADEGVLRVSASDQAGGGELLRIEREAGDPAVLGAALSDLPRALAAELRPFGVSTAWASTYAPPAADGAVAYVLAHRTVLRLGDPEVHAVVPDDADATARRRARIDEAAGRLAAGASRGRGPFPTLLFFAGLSTIRTARSDAYLRYRLQANALCMEASEAHDPVFRLSVLALRLIGDEPMAERRARVLATIPDPVLQRWLLRAEAMWVAA